MSINPAIPVAIPKELLQRTNVPPPREILEVQAQAITEGLAPLVTARVESKAYGEVERHVMILSSSAPSPYDHESVSVWHNKELVYPCRAISSFVATGKDDESVHELDERFADVVRDDRALIDWMRGVFGSAEFSSVIAALIARSGSSERRASA